MTIEPRKSLRTPHDGRPYYCIACGASPQDQLECKHRTSVQAPIPFSVCTLETEDEAKLRRKDWLNGKEIHTHPLARKSLMHDIRHLVLEMLPLVQERVDVLAHIGGILEAQGLSPQPETAEVIGKSRDLRDKMLRLLIRLTAEITSAQSEGVKPP